MTDRLRALWDFGDLDATDGRLRNALALETSEAGRAEVLTQRARVEGLRGRFEAGERLVTQAEGLAGESAVARARIALERGRLRRSGGDASAALPLFEDAFELALEAGEDFVAADAAHMAALAAPDRTRRDGWHERGIEVAERSPDASYWLGPLLNNLGWERYEAGEYEAALEAFERALLARERDPDRPGEIEIARYAVAKTLRALGRADDALPLIERAVAWAEASGEPDSWFHEELGEVYAALGRAEEAQEQAAIAVSLRAEPERI